MIQAIIYLLAIIVAEVVTVFYSPMWGIVCHIMIVVAAILHSAMASKPPYQQLILSLALVPMVRIISLSMPLANIPQVWWYPIIYASLLAAAIMVIRILEYKREQVGLIIGSFPIQLAVALTGFIFGVVEYFILSPEALVAEFTFQEIWLPTLIFLVSTGFVEEIIFRGVLQRSAVDAFGGRGIIYVSLLFAVVHFIHYSVIDIAFVLVVALFFGWVVKKTGSLLGVTLSHGIANAVLYLVVPFFF